MVRWMFVKFIIREYLSPIYEKKMSSYRDCDNSKTEHILIEVTEMIRSENELSSAGDSVGKCLSWIGERTG